MVLFLLVKADQSYDQYLNKQEQEFEGVTYYEILKSSALRIIDPIKSQYYDDLPLKGKFAVGTVLGFTGCKLTSRTVSKGLKLTGAAFICSEVLNQAGILDSIDEDSDSLQVLNRLKLTTKNCINNVRTSIRTNFSLDHIRSAYKDMLDEDRMGTCGLTTGIIAGLIW